MSSAIRSTPQSLLLGQQPQINVIIYVDGCFKSIFGDLCFFTYIRNNDIVVVDDWHPVATVYWYLMCCPTDPFGSSELLDCTAIRASISASIVSSMYLYLTILGRIGCGKQHQKETSLNSKSQFRAIAHRDDGVKGHNNLVPPLRIISTRPLADLQNNDMYRLIQYQNKWSH